MFLLFCKGRPEGLSEVVQRQPQADLQDADGRLLTHL